MNKLFIVVIAASLTGGCGDPRYSYYREVEHQQWRSRVDAVYARVFASYAASYPAPVTTYLDANPPERGRGR